MASCVTLKKVTKSYARTGGRTQRVGQVVLDGIDLEVASGETVTVIGPSGSGKSTLLTCIGGLEPYDGVIIVDGAHVFEPQRQVATVFQAPHLLPWRTTLGNVEYGLELQKVPPAERRQRAEELIELVGLTAARDRYPSQLSGGMQQRANIARALAVRPTLLLMDEPFGALDAITREHLQVEIESLISRGDLTTVFVTHDLGEAVFLGDRVVVLSANGGRLICERTLGAPRPRPLEWKRSPEFQQHCTALWDALVEAGA